MSVLGINAEMDWRQGVTQSNARASRQLNAWRLVELFRWTILLAMVALTSGCQSLSIPRIDPTGQRIFLPDPYRVGLSDVLTHTDRNGLPTRSGVFPEPAYQTPPPPPACIDGTQPSRCSCGKKICSCLHNDRGEKGQMLLTPTTIVAPVGGEVVLLAGICGEDGYLVTKEPIEWMLSPDSVGTFLEVGDDLKGKPLRQWHAKHKVEKRDVDFAKGRTTSKETRITRGTECEDDDLVLKKGQTWISMSSPSEGTSRVTALAPESEIWDRRRQNATIYWVDAKWSFPESMTVPVGQPAILVTQVFQAEGFVAAKGWKVVYRSMNPEIARFDNNQDFIETTVDDDGRAIARLIQLQANNGTAVVSIDVVRPPQAEGRMAALTLAHGERLVTWSAPKLALQAGGPTYALPNSELTYGASIANLGDLAAENVRMQVELPARMQVLDTIPKAASIVGQTVMWEVGPLPAHRKVNVSIVVRPEGEGDVRLVFTGGGVSSANGAVIAAEPNVVQVLVERPRVEVSMVPLNNVNEVEVNKEVIFNVIVASTRTTLNNVKLQITSDPGLQEANTNTNRVEQTIPFLGPGQRREIPVRFIVRQAGQLSAKLVVLANDIAVGDPVQAFVRGVQPVPKVPAVTVDVVPEGNPQDLSIIGKRLVNVLITNNGQVPLTGIRLEVRYDPILEPDQATEGSLPPTGEPKLVWNYPGVVQPGDRSVYKISMVAKGVSGRANITAAVSTAQQVSATNGLTLNIGAAPGSVLPPANPGINNPVLPGGNEGANPNTPVLPQPSNPGGSSVLPGGNPPAGPGNSPVLPGGAGLGLEIRRLNDAFVNQKTTFSISITNRSNQDDRRVVLQVLLPDNVKVEGLNSVGRDLRSQYLSNGEVRSDPIQFLRAGETFTWQLVVTPQIPMEFTLRAAAASELQPNPIQQEITARAVGN